MGRNSGCIWIPPIAQDVDNRPVYHVTVSDINERKLREEEIKKEKETAQLYLDIAGSMLLVLDSAGNISLVNKKGCEILEGTCDELIGMNWFDHFPPIAEKEKLKDVFVTLMRGEIKPSVEYVENLVISKKGTQKWIRWHNTIIKNTEGTIIGTLSSGEDITEHKKLEEELEKSKIRLDLATEASKIGVWEHDLVNNTSIRNLIHDQIFGNNKMISEWEIKILFEHIILEDRSLVQAAFDRAMKTNKLDFECRIIWPDKTIHWITETGKVIQDDTGKPQKILGTVMDITERKRTERMLEASELRYRRLFESAKDGILLLDFGTGKIMDVNPFLINLLGYSKTDFLDKFLWEIGSFKDLIQSNENILTLQTKDYIRYENLPLETKDGKKIDVEFISNVYDVDSRKTIQCNIRDITGQNRLEKKLDEAHYGIKKRTKDLEMINENLDSFAYSVSHDLRSPLRAISGFSQVLIDTQGDKVNDEMRHYLNRINEGAQKMGQLIDDLLVFSRATRNEIKYEKINVENIINDLIKAYRDVEQDRDIEFIVNPLGDVVADREMLKVVFSNLIQNAIKFTIDRKKACIEIGCELKEDDIQFYVKDNGIGFDMRYKDKLFTAFQRLHTDVRFPGTGIGLSTVKRIVLKHGGNIWAKGEVDKGAEFYFTLPSKTHVED